MKYIFNNKIYQSTRLQYWEEKQGVYYFERNFKSNQIVLLREVELIMYILLRRNLKHEDPEENSKSVCRFNWQSNFNNSLNCKP